MTSGAFDPHDLLERSRLGVLATIKASGLPQLSPVTPFYDRTERTIKISVTEGRAKTANLRRDPRAALEVTSADGKAWDLNIYQLQQVIRRCVGGWMGRKIRRRPMIIPMVIEA